MLIAQFPSQTNLWPASYRRWREICLLSCWLLLTACGNIGNNKFYEGLGGVKGVTVTPEGKPVAHATIQVIHHPNLKTQSDSAGQFVLDQIPAGRRELLMFDGKGLAIRMAVWVVKDRLTTIATSQSTLLPTAVLSGRVIAPPRLNNQGIQISIAGTPYLTSTYNVVGDFRLHQLAAGCHTLLVKTPLFTSHKQEEVCVTPGVQRSLPDVIQLKPNQPCESSSTCSQGQICEKSFCVPEGPGQARALRSQQKFGEIKLREEKTLSFDVLQNVGKGPLVVELISMEGDQKHFLLHKQTLPRLPHTLGIDETLKVSVTFQALSFQKEYHATLVVKTNDPNTPQVSISLLGMVVTSQADCLAFDRTSFDLGDQGSRDIPLTISAYNRCGESIAVGPSTSSNQPPPGKERCATTVWGNFSIPTCVETPSTAAVVIPPGESRTLKWTIQPQGFGPLEGKLHLVYTEPTQKDIQLDIPIKAYITAPGLTITPRTLEFGAMAPETTPTQWLSLAFQSTTSAASIQSLTTEVTPSAPYKVLSTRQARTASQSKVYYLPVQFTVPAQVGSAEGKLIFRGLPSLQGLPYYIPIRGSVATPQTPIFPTSHLLGATGACASPVQPLYLTNPGPQTVTVEKITLHAATSNQFVVQHNTLPLLLPPQTRIKLGTVQWQTPSMPGIRALGQLQLSVKIGSQSQIIVTTLRSQTGFRHYDTFTQPIPQKTNMLVFVDQKTEELTDFNNGMIALLRELQNQYLKSQLEYTIHVIHEMAAPAPITPATSNAEAELTRLLQTRILNASHHGLETMSSVRNILRLPDSSSNTVALFFSQSEDLSPYVVNSYIPTSQNFTIFSAVPTQSCKSAEISYRYPLAALQSGGYTLDLCIAQSSLWSFWFTQIQNALLGRRKRFSLRYQPSPESIQVQVVEDGFSRYLDSEQPNRDWRYDPATNQIVLLNYHLPHNAQINISYYTTCE